MIIVFIYEGNGNMCMIIAKECKIHPENRCIDTNYDNLYPSVFCCFLTNLVNKMWRISCLENGKKMLVE